MELKYEDFYEGTEVTVKIFDKKTNIISNMFEYMGDTCDNKIIADSLIRSMCVYESDNNRTDIEDFEEIACGHFDTYSMYALEPIEIKDIINCFQVNDEIVISCIFTTENLDGNTSKDKFGYITIPIDFYIFSRLNIEKYPFKKTSGCGRFYPTVNNIYDYLYWQQDIREGKKSAIGA